MASLLVPGDQVVIASHNKGKITEIRALLKPLGVQVSAASDFALAEPEETEDNFAGNARIKAHFTARETGLPALSDDSGIMVDALDGQPGVYTADWAETDAGRDFLMAMTKVHDMLEERQVSQPRLAHFMCTLCLAFPDGRDFLFEGKVDGHLVWPIRGENGFGFDPMFQPIGKNQTFGEMDPVEKHVMSHRADALAKFLSQITP